MKDCLRYFVLFLAYASGALLTVACLHADIRVNGNVLEGGFVEGAQSALLLLTCASSLFLALQRKNEAFILLAGFFACLFIREQDALLDGVFHGFWAYVAVATAVASVFFALRGSGPAVLVRKLGELTGTQPFAALLCAMAFLLVFSRLFGMQEVWTQLLQGANLRTVKNCVEETTELMGYATAFVSILWCLVERQGK